VLSLKVLCCVVLCCAVLCSAVSGWPHTLDLPVQVLPEVLSSFQPQLVLYDAGVDVHVDDDLGRLAVTDQGEQQ